MHTQRIKSIKSIGICKTLDFEIDHQDHNFYANGIVVSNSHSFGYAALSASTTWLKINYPLHFFAVLFQNAAGQEEIDLIYKELVDFGIKLLPPDLIKSEDHFTVEEPNIRFGLSSIKKVAGKGLYKLKNFRTKFMNKFELWDAAENAKINITLLSALIQAGCLDSLVDKTRSKLVAETYFWNILTPREKKEFHDRAKKYGYNTFKIFHNLKEVGFFKETRLATLERDFKPYKEIFEQNSKNENFANWAYERYYLGFTYSRNLRDSLNSPYSILTLKEFENMEGEGKIKVVGVVSNCARKKAKSSGKDYFEINLTDETGNCKAMIWEKSLHIIEKMGIPQKENILTVTGRKWNDILSVDGFEIEDHKIYIAKKDLTAAKKLAE